MDPLPQNIVCFERLVSWMTDEELQGITQRVSTAKQRAVVSGEVNHRFALMKELQHLPQ